MRHKSADSAPVVVIGGGLAGRTTATILAQAGASATLLEKRTESVARLLLSMAKRAPRSMSFSVEENNEKLAVIVWWPAGQPYAAVTLDCAGKTTINVAIVSNYITTLFGTRVRKNA